MRKLTKREQRILILCISIAFVYVSYNTLFKPINERINYLDQKIQGQQKDIRKNLRVIRKARNLNNSYERYEKQFKQSKSNEQVMSALLSEIEQVAIDLGLRISDLKPRKVKSTDFFNRFSVSLTINSELIDIVHFLYTLQNDPHLFSVEEVRFDKGSKRREKSLKTRLVLSKVLIP